MFGWGGGDDRHMSIGEWALITLGATGCVAAIVMLVKRPQRSDRGRVSYQGLLRRRASPDDQSR
jgi:hypothetical protein